MMVVAIETDSAKRVSEPRLLFEAAYATNPYGNSFYDIAPDGRRFLMIREGSAQRQLKLVLRWFDDLKRIAPENR
jgi:hypothetical protein